MSTARWPGCSAEEAGRTQHVEVRQLAAQDLHREGRIAHQKVASADSFADVLTKLVAVAVMREPPCIGVA